MIAEYKELSQCSEGPIWQASIADEIGRHAQGFGAVKGTNTILFIHPSAMPKGRKATYVRIVSAMRPEKANPYRVRWTVGGDKVEYPFDVSTKTADLTMAKLLFNSVLSTPNARFMTADLKDFYLVRPATIQPRIEIMSYAAVLRLPRHGARIFNWNCRNFVDGHQRRQNSRTSSHMQL